MNKKELNDLKKNFSDKCGFFTFNQVLRAFVDSDKNILCRRNSLLGVMPSEDIEYKPQLEAASGYGLNIVQGGFMSPPEHEENYLNS